ncbi:hypothetical protein Pelo_7410 [Pelomyxa schiedti]|nr:hypothetical protein Pelo_7410 [Pelomyxa schiedti]
MVVFELNSPRNQARRGPLPLHERQRKSMEVQIVSVIKAKEQFLAIATSSSPRCGAESPARHLAAGCGPLLRDTLGLRWVLRPASWLCARVAPAPTPTSELRGCGYLAVLVSHTLGSLRGPLVTTTSNTYRGNYASDREWLGPAWRMSMDGWGFDRWFCVRDVAAPGGGRHVVQKLTQDPDLRRSGVPHRKVDCGMWGRGVHLYDCNSRWVVIVGGVSKTTVHVWKVPPSSSSRLNEDSTRDDDSRNEQAFTVREFPMDGGRLQSVKLTDADKVQIMCEVEQTKHSDLMWIEVDIAESLGTGVLVSRAVVKWDWKVSYNLKGKDARVFWSGLILTDKNELLAPSGDVVVTLPSKPWLLDHIHFACIADSRGVYPRVLIFKLSQPTQPCLSVSLVTPEFPIDRVSGGMGSLVTCGMTEKGASNALVVMFCDPWSGMTVLKARFLPRQLTDTLDWSGAEITISLPADC